MSIITLTSASGAPGVTTTTLGLAATWPRPVVAVEADPVGGSAMLAGYFRGFQPPLQSVVDLVLAHRHGHLPERHATALIPLPGAAATILPGPRSHAQAHSALELWEPLIRLWQGLGGVATAEDGNVDGIDVLVDAGRLGMESYPEAMLRFSDLVVMVLRSDLPSLAAARQWGQWAAETRRDHPEYPPWGVVVVGVGQPYLAGEVATVMGAPVIATIRPHPRGATHFSHGATLKRKTPLRTDLVHCGQAIRDTIAANHRLRGAFMAASISSPGVSDSPMAEASLVGGRSPVSDGGEGGTP